MAFFLVSYFVFRVLIAFIAISAFKRFQTQMNIHVVFQAYLDIETLSTLVTLELLLMVFLVNVYRVFSQTLLSVESPLTLSTGVCWVTVLKHMELIP